MNSRKVLAAVLASVCAVSATAVVASAAIDLEPVYVDSGNGYKAGSDWIKISKPDSVDASKIATVRVTVTSNTHQGSAEFLSACLAGGASALEDGSDWTWVQGAGFTAAKSVSNGVIVYEIPLATGDFTAADIDWGNYNVGFSSFGSDVDWTVDDGWAETGTFEAAITKIEFLDAQGNNLEGSGGNNGGGTGGGTEGGGNEETGGNGGSTIPGGTVLISTPTVLPADWSAAVQITSDLLKNAKPGDTLVLALSGTVDTPQLQFKDGSWGTLPGNTTAANASEWWDGIDLTVGATSYTYTLTKEDIAIIKADGTVIIGGCNVTINSVTYCNTGTDDDDSSSTPDTPSGGILPPSSVIVPSGTTSGGSTSGGNSSTNAPAQVIEGEADVKPGTEVKIETDAGEITVTTAEDDTALEGTKFVVETVKDTEKDITDAIGANAPAETKEIAAAAEKAVDDGDAVVLDLSFEKDGGKVQPGKSVTVKLPVPAALKGADKIFVYHVSEDGISLVATPDVKDGMISFTANTFSPYIFSKVELKAAGNTTSSGNTNNPNTGIGLAIAPLALVGAAAAIVATSKKRK